MVDHTRLVRRIFDTRGKIEEEEGTILHDSMSKKLINSPERAVDESLYGLVRVHPGLTLLADHRVVVRSDIDVGKVKKWEGSVYLIIYNCGYFTGLALFDIIIVGNSACVCVWGL